MATEYFSPSGTFLSSNTVGIIDDPNYTVYVGLTGNDNTGKGTLEKPYKSPHRAMYHLQNHFITENGFATIKCGAGRYTFDKPIEVRHPQGARIGIRGEESKDYILAKCSRWRSSHSNLGSSTTSPASPAAGSTTDTLDTLFGTTACRFYEAGVHLNPIDWNTTGNKINPSDASSKAGIGVENGASGDYVLVRDTTFAHKDNYDVVHEDWGADGTNASDGAALSHDTTFKNKQSTRRTALLGAHIIHSNDEDAGVNYICKYYNYPTMMAPNWSKNTDQNVDNTRPIWFGGFGAGDYPESQSSAEFDFPGAASDEGDLGPSKWGQGDYFSGPYPPINTSAQMEHNGYGHPTRFGNTAEGWTIDQFDKTIVVPTENFVGYSVTGKQHKFRDMRPSENWHMSLNRLELTHIRTIFEFTNAEKSCIDIGGGDFGFIQDLVLEGKWQQFSKHKNGLTAGVANQEDDYIEKKPYGYANSGIKIYNSGSLSYDLGTTGGSAAETRFSRYRTHKPEGEDITINNVGINGFEYGVHCTNNSSANFNDIVISNCRYGIMVQRGSNCDAMRSVITGIERNCINVDNASTMHAMRSIVGFAGCPIVTISCNNNNTSVTAGYRDSTFKSGDVIALVDTGTAGHVGDTVGIVCSWGPIAGEPGRASLSFYDYIQKYRIAYNTPTTDLVDALNTGGLTLAMESKDSTSTVATDTHPTHGHLDFNTASNSVFGTGIYANRGSSIIAPESLAGNVGHAGVSSYRNSHIDANRSLVHNALMGYRTQLGTVDAGDSKAMNISGHAYRASYNGTIMARNSTAENVRRGWGTHYSGAGYSIYGHWIEGRSRFCDSVFEVDGNSTQRIQHLWCTVNGGDDGSNNTWDAHNNSEDIPEGLMDSGLILNLINGWTDTTYTS